jgi:hypothetical protein
MPASASLQRSRLVVSSAGPTGASAGGSAMPAR